MSHHYRASSLISQQLTSSFVQLAEPSALCSDIHFFSKLLPTVQCCCCNKSATMTPSPGTTICFVEQMLPGLEGRKNDTTWTRQSRINSTALLLVMWGPSVRTFPYRIRANCIVQRYRTRQNRRPLSKPRFLSVSPPAHIKPNLHLNHVK